VQAAEPVVVAAAVDFLVLPVAVAGPVVAERPGELALDFIFLPRRFLGQLLQ
jgi:hypothetical protein